MWSNFIGDVVGAVVALLVTAIGTYGGFYIKRLDTKLRRKTLLDEINRYVEMAKDVKSFSFMSEEDKTEMIYEKASEFASDNEVQISAKELRIMVERALQSIDRLEAIGLSLVNKRLLKEKENNNGAD